MHGAGCSDERACRRRVVAFDGERDRVRAGIPLGGKEDRRRDLDRRKRRVLATGIYFQADAGSRASNQDDYARAHGGGGDPCTTQATCEEYQRIKDGRDAAVMRSIITFAVVPVPLLVAEVTNLLWSNESRAPAQAAGLRLTPFAAAGGAGLGVTGRY